MPGRPWTEKEDQKLTFGWGAIPLPKLMRQLNRTRIAIIRRAAHLELGGLRRGHRSMAQLLRDTGHTRPTINMIAERLGLRFRRIHRGDRVYKTETVRAIAVSDAQAEAIFKYLREHRHYRRHFWSAAVKRTNGGVWGVGIKPPACLRCRSNKKPHYAKGFCKPCYNFRSKKKSV